MRDTLHMTTARASGQSKNKPNWQLIDSGRAQLATVYYGPDFLTLKCLSLQDFTYTKMPKNGHRQIEVTATIYSCILRIYMSMSYS